MKGGRAAGGLVPIEILVFHQVGRQVADDRWLMTLAHTRGGPTSVHECKPNSDVALPQSTLLKQLPALSALYLSTVMTPIS